MVGFLDKGDIVGHHLSVPFPAPEANKKKSSGVQDLDGNVIAHDDSLLSLKALLSAAAGSRENSRESR